jgi:prevent-host-death family protein
MIIISGREFRENQGKYLDMARDGQDVVLKSRGRGSFKVVPVLADDTLMTKEEFHAKIDRAVASIKAGKGKTVHGKKELQDYLDSL